MTQSRLFLAALFLLQTSFIADAASIYSGQIMEDPKNACSFVSPAAAWTKGEKIPVIVCLPGKGVQTRDDLKVWKAPAEDAGFFVVSVGIDYDTIKKEEDLRWIQFRIRKTLEKFSKIYNLRSDKVYITGTSAGGVVALSLATRYPDDYIATGLISAGSIQFSSSLYLINVEHRHFYMIHGDKDLSAPIQKAYQTKQLLEEAGADVTFMKIPYGEHALPAFVYETMAKWFLYQEKLVREDSTKDE